VARAVAERLAVRLGQAFVVDNRGGAAGTVGASAAQSAAADGYTLFLAPTAVFVITPHLRKVPYEPLTGFEPVALIATSPGIAVVHKDSPVRSMADLVAQAKANPGKLSFGSAGPGSITQLYGEMLKLQAGVDMLHVPFKGSADALNALLGKQVDVIIDPVALAQVRGGTVRALAVFGDRRVPSLPDVPTIAESGFPIDVPSWFGLFAPKGTPQPIVARLSAEVQTTLKEPDLLERLAKLNLFPAYLDPAAFAKQLREDDRNLGELIRKANIKGD
jgi:tripartite-type tricarboxylate transporter receptor subunit TctC